jgi:thymidylate synthase
LTFTYSESSADDLLHQVFEALIESEDRPVPTKGPTREARAVTLELTNPRARLSRSETRGRLFSCLAELCWYLSGSGRVEPIEFYLSHYREAAEADGIVHGAYGPRLFGFDGFDQVRYVLDTLRARPDSRQAVIQIFDHGDVSSRYNHVPCTCMLQYFVRSDRLEAVTFMRSNDAYLGLPHDLFAFTMLQELIARSLNVEIGRYVHMVGSLHLYETNLEQAQFFLEEGWQSSIEMPSMPSGDPWTAVQRLVAAEEELRGGADPLGFDFDVEPYWQDLERLFAIFALKVGGRSSDIPTIREGLSSDIYDVFLFGLGE